MELTPFSLVLTTRSTATPLTADTGIGAATTPASASTVAATIGAGRSRRDELMPDKDAI
ncbi:hypothetical protein B0I32_14057 [Nonomuraea fuscirosea]|uniref:Uncharacterized protein n=1 Tax=Nonomuraea fuscirosea TaxID=1291556 RepID=A0A2T0LXQ7_9ACTN|nr:hypothetical protein B0I32_14057 [Nonomuraea fuscirosea]